MTHAAVHMRIFDPAPTDDLVAKRTSAIADIAKKFGEQRSVEAILRSANDLALAAEPDAQCSAEQSQMIEAAIRTLSTAFIAEERPIEMLVCGMLGALQSLNGSSGTVSGSTTVNDVFALGLWSALAFQKKSADAKFEALRGELQESAHAHCVRTASKSRERLFVVDPEFKTPESFDPAGVEKSLRPFGVSIGNLRANAAVDREEIDLLWWALSDWSSILKRRLSTDESAAAAAVASGVEMGYLLRRIPAEAHRHLVLRNVPAAKSLTLPELLSALGEDRPALAAAFKEETGVVSQCPAVFPLANALQTGEAKDANAKVKRLIEDWAARALLEASIAHLTSHIPSVAV
jgi:hypothetical protein